MTSCFCVQSPSHGQLFSIPWTAARQASLSFTISWSLLKLMSIKSVMPSNHLILCPPPSPPALDLSQHQSLFQWVGSSHQVVNNIYYYIYVYCIYISHVSHIIVVAIVTYVVVYIYVYIYSAYYLYIYVIYYLIIPTKILKLCNSVYIIYVIYNPTLVAFQIYLCYLKSGLLNQHFLD